MSTEQELNGFLKEVERRAFKRTVYAVRDEDAALDIVQDAMIRLAEKYADRPAAEWPLLFQRILSNATLDWFRRRRTREAVMQNFSSLQTTDEDGDSADLLEFLEVAGDVHQDEAGEPLLQRKQTLALLEDEISRLPDRQREAFLLRYWEELDVSETAEAMGCSEGSVKTHCSRAVHALAKALKNRGFAP
ncbi:MAG: RNA polymerase sigma factor [Betaproteobacteria bacterium]|nr:RNA polymerase sigma factor [Betaproteobacteria bacterium]